MSRQRFFIVHWTGVRRPGGEEEFLVPDHLEGFFDDDDDMYEETRLQGKIFIKTNDGRYPREVDLERMVMDKADLDSPPFIGVVQELGREDYMSYIDGRVSGPSRQEEGPGDYL